MLAASLAIWRFHPANVLSVQTNSMAPTLVKGDAIVLKHSNLSTLKVGDIVSYRSPLNPNVIITHRIVFIDKSRSVVVTKGDNVATTDGPINVSQIVGQVSRTIDRLGYILDFLRSPTGLITTLYIPAIGIFSLELSRLTKYYLRPTYRLHQST